MKLLGTALFAMAFLQPGRPPLPAIYDPNPGPVVILAGESDELDDRQIAFIADGVAGGSADEDEKLGAFLLCFRPSYAPSLIGRTRKKALELTADALLSAGARVVTVGTERLCSSIPQVQLPESIANAPARRSARGFASERPLANRWRYGEPGAQRSGPSSTGPPRRNRGRRLLKSARTSASPNVAERFRARFPLCRCGAG